MEKQRMNADRGVVRLKMIYNNTGSWPGLQAAWGLSVWVASLEGNLLFDTGGDAAILRDNMHSLGLDPGSLIKLFLSHDHWDHRNGLEWLLEETGHAAEVIVPAEVKEKYGIDYPAALIRGVADPEEILPGIWTTGSFSTTYKDAPLHEQALVIIRGDSLWLLNGCSHPGVIPMVRHVKKSFPGKRIALVAGGFHLTGQTADEVRIISDLFRQEGVEHIAPSHCTGDEAISLFRKEWGASITCFNLGDERVLS
ncbi:MAG: MBL fold metallo-hydrolase [Prolixibacteraceae bacterium]|nr:MBL fold metallo-hydrolase [Prolixibacteraceae bacterium]